MSAPGAWAAVAAGLAVAGVATLLPARPPGPSRSRRSTALAGSLSSGLATAGAAVLARLHVDRLGPPGRLADRVVAAGSPGGLSPRDWAALKWACGAGALVLGLATSSAMPGRLGIALTAAAPVAGYLLPDYRLARTARRRADGALRELPGMLDLLRVTIEAGRSPVAAMGAVAERFDGPLAAEWRAAAAEVALGVTRDAALDNLRRRMPVDGVRTLVDSLTNANRSGLALGEVLAAQAASARHERRQQIRERAARAGPKMQLVVALVLVPSVLLTLGAVLVAELTSTGIGFAY